MYTMQPVIVMGSYRWDQDILPLDEFEERLRALRRQMASEGWGGLIVHADTQDSALMIWLTNFFPRLRWALALIGPEGQPELLVAGGTRDLPAASMLTWCQSVRSYGDAPRLIADWLGRLRRTAAPAGAAEGAIGPIAIHGLQRMRTPVRRTLLQALGDQASMPADDALAPLLRGKRWRELSVIRQAHRLLAGTVAQLRQRWDAGDATKSAVIAAERYARMEQAQDVRILFSLDQGRTLLPFEDFSDERGDTLVAFVAVRYLGYWAQAYVTHGAAGSAALQATEQTLRALRAAAAPGTDGRRLAEAAAAEAAAAGAAAAGAAAAATQRASVPPVGITPHPMLEGRHGYGVGLDLAEAPFFDAQGSQPMREGGVYTLQAGFTAPSGAALLSATVCIVDGQIEDLYSPI